MRHTLRFAAAGIQMLGIVVVIAACMWCLAAAVGGLLLDLGWVATSPVRLSPLATAEQAAAAPALLCMWIACSLATGALTAWWSSDVNSVGSGVRIAAGAVAAGLLHWLALWDMVALGWSDADQLCDFVVPALLYALAGTLGASVTLYCIKQLRR